MNVPARDTKRGVVLADGVLVGPVQQAVHMALGVVVQLDLPHAELVGGAISGIFRDLRDGLGTQLQILVKCMNRGTSCSYSLTNRFIRNVRLLGLREIGSEYRGFRAHYLYFAASAGLFLPGDAARRRCR